MPVSVRIVGRMRASQQDRLRAKAAFSRRRLPILAAQKAVKSESEVVIEKDIDSSISGGGMGGDLFGERRGGSKGDIAPYIRRGGGGFVRRKEKGK